MADINAHTFSEAPPEHPYREELIDNHMANKVSLELVRQGRVDRYVELQMDLDLVSYRRFASFADKERQICEQKKLAIDAQIENIKALTDRATTSGVAIGIQNRTQIMMGYLQAESDHFAKQVEAFKALVLSYDAKLMDTNRKILAPKVEELKPYHDNYDAMVRYMSIINYVAADEETEAIVERIKAKSRDSHELAPSTEEGEGKAE